MFSRRSRSVIDFLVILSALTRSGTNAHQRTKTDRPGQQPDQIITGGKFHTLIRTCLNKDKNLRYTDE